jgi:hypothetical protein
VSSPNAEPENRIVVRKGLQRGAIEYLREHPLLFLHWWAMKGTVPWYGVHVQSSFGVETAKLGGSNTKSST